MPTVKNAAKLAIATTLVNLAFISIISYINLIAQILVVKNILLV